MTTEHTMTPRSFIDFSPEERKRLLDKSADLPEGFNDWPIEKQGEFFDNKAAAIIAAKQKREAAENAVMAELAAKAAGKQQAAAPKKQPASDLWDRGAPPHAEAPSKAPRPIRFPLERARDFAPPSSEDWLIKGLIPREGVGTLFGAPGEYKTFTAIHLCLHIATGETWGRRKVKHIGPVVYIAVEGARGSKKRIQGIIKAHGVSDPQIFQISKPINFGTSNDHAQALVEDITAQGVKPVLIVVDTLSASLNGGEENGPGMSMFLSNCSRLSTHFGCFVLAVHHVGHNAEGRERGHSSLGGNTDTRISCKKPERLRASITFEKVKDDEDKIAFDLGLEKVFFGLDEDGDPITTLAVMSAVEREVEPKKADKGSVPASERLLKDMVEQAMIDAGVECHPLPNGPKIKVVTEDAVRKRYYARMAERAEPGEGQEKVDARQKKAFRRSLDSALKAKRLIAADQAGQTVIWFPQADGVKS
jgi:AAA domain